MKRFTALALALCLAFGGTALADETITEQGGEVQTNVFFTIATTYTIVIPSQVSLKSDQTVSSATIEAKNVKLPDKKMVAVYLSNMSSDETSPFVKLKNGADSDKVSYKIYSDAAATTPIGCGSEVCHFPTDGSSNVYFKLTETPLYAGEYTDTITFAVSLIDQGE